jgi:hypothetical protein
MNYLQCSLPTMEYPSTTIFAYPSTITFAMSQDLEYLSTTVDIGANNINAYGTL